MTSVSTGPVQHTGGQQEVPMTEEATEEPRPNDENRRRYEELLAAKKRARTDQGVTGRPTDSRQGRPAPGKKEFRRRKV